MRPLHSDTLELFYPAHSCDTGHTGDGLGFFCSLYHQVSRSRQTFNTTLVPLLQHLSDFPTGGEKARPRRANWTYGIANVRFELESAEVSFILHRNIAPLTPTLQLDRPDVPGARRGSLLEARSVIPGTSSC